MLKSTVATPVRLVAFTYFPMLVQPDGSDGFDGISCNAMFSALVKLNVVVVPVRFTVIASPLVILKKPF